MRHAMIKSIALALVLAPLPARAVDRDSLALLGRCQGQHETTNQGVVGSNPAGRANKFNWLSKDNPLSFLVG